MKKDMLPLYIAVTSGIFTLLTTIADNLTKNVQIVLDTAKSVSGKAVEFNLITFVMKYYKPIMFGTVSVVAIVVFCILKFRKHRVSREKK